MTSYVFRKEKIVFYKVDVFPIREKTGEVDYYMYIVREIAPVEVDSILKEEKESILKFLEKTSDGVVIIDKDGHILYMNSAAELLLEQKKEELIGKNFGLPLPEQESSEVEYLSSRGKKYIEMKFAEIEWLNKPAYFVLLHDITHIKIKEKRSQKITQDLLKIVKSSISILSVEKLINEISSAIQEVIGCDICLFYVFNKERKQFKPESAIGLRKNQIPFFRSESFQYKDPFFKELFKKKKPVYLNSSSAKAKKLLRWLKGINTLVFIPFIVRKDPLGLAIAVYKKEKEFVETEIEILEGIASLGSATFENARLYRDVIEKSMELSHNIQTIETMAEIDRAILSMLDQQSILEIVASMISKAISCDSCTITIVDKESKNFIFKAGFGRKHILSKDTTIPFEATNATDVLETERFQYIPDLSKLTEIFPFEKRLLMEGFRSVIRVPIKAKSKVIGVLSLESKKPSEFTPKDLSTLETLSNQVGVALENARLLSENEELFMGTIRAFSKIIDAKSPWTKGHSERVTKYALAIGKEIGLSEEQMKNLEIAGLLHDIGKIGISELILDKPDKLSEEEYSVIKKHPDVGADILLPIKQLKEVIPAIRHHHEHFDGSGYPMGLKGEEIPLLARILAVADAFDAMHSDRPYRRGMSIDEIVQELKRCKGTQFDPKIVDAFLKVLPKLLPN